MGDRDQNDPGRRRKTGRWRVATLLGLYRPALVAAALGLLFSLAGAAAVARWEDRVNKIEFENAAETQSIVMQNGMNEYISRLVALRTLFESSNEGVTRSEFETFSGRLFERYPGLLRVGWLPGISRKERAEYEAAAIADGVSGYRIKALDGKAFVTAPQGEEYFPVFYSTQPKTSPVYGMDYMSVPDRKAVLERARDNDDIAAIRTELYARNEDSKLPNVLVIVPVYAKGTSRETIADRRRNITGFVVGIFDLPLLMQAIRVRTGASPAVSVNVYQPFNTRTISLEGMLPDYASAAAAPQSIGDVARGRHWSGGLRIGDADWQVRAVPTAGGALETSYDRAGAVLTVGMLLTLSLSTYLMLASRNSRRLSLANRRVLELAQTDVLTGLPNRAFFLARLDELNSQLKDGGWTFSILMLDLDRFKNVNDSLGHGAGDALLRLVAQRLKSAVRSTDVLARLGGDEFAIIQEGCDDQRAASTELAARIAKLVSEPFLLPGHRVEIGTSIGIAIAPDHGSDQEQLLKKADLALYRSKSAGRNCFTIYDEAMSAELEARNTLEGDLRDAIARCQLEVHYQPFMDAGTGARRGFEALVRWRHPVRGLIPPDQFIALAEETGLIVPLGEFVLRRACADAASWPSDLMVAVNLSPIQFKEADLFDVICAALHDSGLSPQRLEIEITESVLLERGAENHAFMERLKGIGIELALDDFGTGYSSLSYLTAFPFDKIKIDKSFIRSLTHQPRSSAIISSIVTLARGLDMAVTAEGVETSEEFERLKALGVNFAQGYLFGRPRPIAEIELDGPSSRSQRDAA
ncbi:bifunctional diguanylate cyclase/phosphodiesterase [Bradyrhizobium guangdongense]|uniref:Histidine kinase n=1 Tax=Bradyrhizobium guangdongense TaxID=1325090 RepID=A0A410V342_9BRAD|nr:EAL domain-containing protein [Bradyrhizobium guangdongense]QAU38058.1 histidine kinase [Bradyrhizobium guangdongense]QOZ59113.1 histidine kinase [Bradyrhizobium guangdongense]GGI18955.1 histidine kinase [Bradyrhizobium guangdongense]